MQADYLSLPGPVYARTILPSPDMGFAVDACHRYFLDKKRGGGGDEGRRAETADHVIR